MSRRISGLLQKSAAEDTVAATSWNSNLPRSATATPAYGAGRRRSNRAAACWRSRNFTSQTIRTRRRSGGTTRPNVREPLSSAAFTLLRRCWQRPRSQTPFPSQRHLGRHGIADSGVARNACRRRPDARRHLSDRRQAILSHEMCVRNGLRRRRVGLIRDARPTGPGDKLGFGKQVLLNAEDMTLLASRGLRHPWSVRMGIGGRHADLRDDSPALRRVAMCAGPRQRRVRDHRRSPVKSPPRGTDRQ